MTIDESLDNVLYVAARQGLTIYSMEISGAEYDLLLECLGSLAQQTQYGIKYPGPRNYVYIKKEIEK